MDWIWIVILLALGIAGVVCPEKLWKLEHFLTVKGGEPTEAYLGISRVIGVLCVLVALFCIAVAIFT